MQKTSSHLSGIADHHSVSHTISIHPFRKKPCKREIHLWSKVDNDKLINDTKIFRDSFLKLFTPSCNVNEIWNFIKKEINKIIQDNVPTKVTSSKSHQPWINTKTKRLLRKKERWFKKAKQINNEATWKIYKKIKSQTQKACRQTHNQFLNDMFKDDASNKKLFSYVKSRKQENVGIPDLKSDKALPVRGRTCSQAIRVCFFEPLTPCPGKAR